MNHFLILIHECVDQLWTRFVFSACLCEITNFRNEISEIWETSNKISLDKESLLCESDVNKFYDIQVALGQFHIQVSRLNEIFKDNKTQFLTAETLKEKRKDKQIEIMDSIFYHYLKDDAIYMDKAIRNLVDIVEKHKLHETTSEYCKIYDFKKI